MEGERERESGTRCNCCEGVECGWVGWCVFIQTVTSFDVKSKKKNQKKSLFAQHSQNAALVVVVVVYFPVCRWREKK